MYVFKANSYCPIGRKTIRSSKAFKKEVSKMRINATRTTRDVKVDTKVNPVKPEKKHNPTKKKRKPRVALLKKKSSPKKRKRVPATTAKVEPKEEKTPTTGARRSKRRRVSLNPRKPV